MAEIEEFLKLGTMVIGAGLLLGMTEALISPGAIYEKIEPMHAKAESLLDKVV